MSGSKLAWQRLWVSPTTHGRIRLVCYLTLSMSRLCFSNLPFKDVYGDIPGPHHETKGQLRELSTMHSRGNRPHFACLPCLSHCLLAALWMEHADSTRCLILGRLDPSHAHDSDRRAKHYGFYRAHLFLARIQVSEPTLQPAMHVKPLGSDRI